VPSDVQLNSLPSEAEQLAPQLRGFSYVVVEELVAIVDPRTRKVEIDCTSLAVTVRATAWDIAADTGVVKFGNGP
jgi:hypothetical protein